MYTAWDRNHMNILQEEYIQCQKAKHSKFIQVICIHSSQDYAWEWDPVGGITEI